MEKQKGHQMKQDDATGTAEDSGSSKETIQWPRREKMATVAWQQEDQMKQDATTRQQKTQEAVAG